MIPGTPRGPMVLYVGWRRDVELEVAPVDLGCGAGRITCFECGGDGNWGKFAPEIVGRDARCVDCKGSGFQLVSI